VSFEVFTEIKMATFSEFDLCIRGNMLRPPSDLNFPSSISNDRTRNVPLTT
jgi:hypothetical protein